MNRCGEVSQTNTSVFYRNHNAFWFPSQSQFRGEITPADYENTDTPETTLIKSKPTTLSTIEEKGCTYKDKCVIITETMQQINQTKPLKLF